MPAATGPSLRKPVICKTITAKHVTFGIDDEETGVRIDFRLTRGELRILQDEIDLLLNGEPTTELALGIADLED